MDKAQGKSCPISKHAKANPVASDLTRYRNRDPILQPDEERELVRRSQAGDGDAKRELVVRFQRQVLKIAGRFHGPPFEERLAVGNIGLLKAIRDFDLASNFRLATAAGMYIANEIRTFVRSHYRRWLLHGASLISLDRISDSVERHERAVERSCFPSEQAAYIH
jgi:DNA-directed RNA polymerase sigma subunit (sigma70/sigma32)